MTHQSFEDAPSPNFSEHEARNKEFREAAGDAFSKASDTARDAAEKAKRAASDAASERVRPCHGLFERPDWRWRSICQSLCRFHEDCSGRFGTRKPDARRRRQRICSQCRPLRRSTGGSDRRPIGQECVRSHSAEAGVSVWTGGTRRVFRISDVQNRQRHFRVVTSHPAGAQSCRQLQ